MKQKKVLVVDDDKDARDFVKFVLKPEGFKVTDACDGKEGMEKLYKEKPDLAILDVNMPKMNGYDMCKKIRKSDMFFHLPIIMLTVRGKMNDKINGLNNGSDIYLTKPIHPKELITRVKKLTSKQ